MSLIGSGETWILLFVMTGCVAFGVWLESRFRWAARISALVIILLLAIILANIRIIPAEAPVYDFVWDYCLPLSLPLLLFKSDIRKICSESGQLLAAFLIGAAGTVVGALVSYLIFKGAINELPGLAAMLTGTYIGGSVNFAVLGSVFGVSGESVSAATIADNLNMAVYFLVLLAIPVKSKTAGNTIKNVDTACAKISDSGKPGSGCGVTGQKKLSVKAFSVGIAVSVFIIAISDMISGFLGKSIPDSNGVLMALNSLGGNRYLWITTFSVVFSTVFSEKIRQLAGLQEIGTFFIYCFIFVVGAPASVMGIIKNSPLMLLFALVIVAFNMLFTFVFGFIFHMDRKTLIIASNANVGGPTTAAGMAIAKGWDELVGPALLVGCLGYVIGNYMGIIVGNMLL